jgi:hypothetical protein
MQFGNTGVVTAQGTITYPNSLVCPSKIDTATIEVRKLPVAAIGEYEKDCGPFYKAELLRDTLNKGVHISWKVDNSSTGVKKIIDDEIVAVTKKGNLILTLEKNGCFDQDTMAVKQMFELEASAAIEGKLCHDSTLYYLETFADNECYKWFYVNPDNDIKVIVNENTKPYYKTRNGNVPLLIKYTCGTPCSGKIVTNRTVPQSDDNCTEDDSGLNDSISAWDVYPVPAYDVVHIKSEAMEKGNYRLEMITGNGMMIQQTILRHVGGALDFPIDLSSFPAGVYFIGLNGEKKKVIIVK